MIASAFSYVVEQASQHSDEIKDPMMAICTFSLLGSANPEAIRTGGGILKLVEFLKHPDLKIKVAASKVLSDVSRPVHENRWAIYEAGAIPALVKMLALEDGEAQGHAMEVLSYMGTELNRGAQDATRKEGGIELLIRILEHGVDELKAMAVSTLSNLGKANTENLEKIRKGGTFPLLIREMRRGQEELAFRTLLATCNLSCVVENQDAFREANGFAPLLHLLSSGSPKVKVMAANALGNLAVMNPTNQAFIKTCGADKVLHKCLSSRDEALRTAAARVFSIVSKDSVHELLNSSRVKDFLQSLGAKPISRAAPSAPTKKPISPDSIASLASILETETSESKLQRTFKRICTLATEHTANSFLLANSAILPQLVRFLNFPKKEISNEAARVIFALADNSERLDFLAMIAKMVSNLANPESIYERQMAAATLAHIACLSTDRRDTFRMCGGITNIVACLDDQPQVLLEVVNLMQKVAHCNTENKVALRKAGAIPILLNYILDRPTDPDPQIISGALLAIVKDNQDSINALVLAAKERIDAIAVLLLCANGNMETLAKFIFRHLPRQGAPKEIEDTALDIVMKGHKDVVKGTLAVLHNISQEENIRRALNIISSVVFLHPERRVDFCESEVLGHLTILAIESEEDTVPIAEHVIQLLCM